MIRPKAAPILNIGMRLPDGTGRVEAKTVRKNCKNKEPLYKTLRKLCSVQYRCSHVDTKCDKNIAVFIGPLRNNCRLFRRQIIAHPGEVGEQTHNLLSSRQG